MTAAIVVFAGLGAALTALIALLVPQRLGLLVAVGRLDAARTAPAAARTAPARDDTGHLSRQAQLGLMTRARLGHLVRPGRTPHGPAGQRDADLAVTGIAEELLIGRMVLTGLAGFCFLPALALVLAPVGFGLPATVLVIGTPALGAGFAWLPRVALRRAAEVRRREFRRALSCYLDLVAMSLAGGRGAPQALPEAAALSDGWAFRMIADALATARLSGTGPWRGLGELGDRIGVAELRELAGALALVGDHGARVRDTLTARAATLRRRALTDAEGQAAQADQAMRIAQVLLAFGFLILVAYPALAAVLAL
ncbi:type II secretion system F family protein [Sporichthya polymorpha]|uniref:type II secretion system F family protein n=1 Tax=Sporichthya polymorpha TaxID=35751 RepID=UPI000381A653|nr:type II secretion system F family protein [Sporichthya polymorpha]